MSAPGEQPARDVVTVAAPSLIYVALAQRADFDRIALPLVDHGAGAIGHVLTKTATAGLCFVVFQFWLQRPAAAADLAAARADEQERA